MPGIYVIAQLRDGKMTRPGFEAIGQARQIARKLGMGVCAALLGADLKSAAASLGSYRVDEIHIFEDPLLKDYTNEAYAAVLGGFLKAQQPDVLLLPATTFGKDLAPALAAILETGLAADCTELAADGNALSFVRPIYAGKILETVKIPEAKPKMATLRPRAFGITKALEPGKPRVVREKAQIRQLRSRILEVAGISEGKVELTQADIVVSGGRGLKGPENFKLLEELASVLGAAVGASRAVVDAGWRPHSDQVGQTGKVVSPKLYIACGISGAIQHLVGISASKCILAINKDPDAPIFKKADYGIVGDLFAVVPLLIEEFKKALRGA